MIAVFEPGETLASRRLQFSRFAAGDSEALSDWISTALTPDWEFEDFSSQILAERAVLISDLSSGEALGAATISTHKPLEGTASITFLGIDPVRRFRGLGGEAGLAIESHIRKRLGVERIFVPVPDGRGLAVYFWLRLGFRPVLKSEAPWPLTGLSTNPRPGIWLLRAQE